MNSLAALQPAYVLHKQPYRETSVLIDLMTRDHGRIRAIARGVRQPRSAWRALLQPFIPLVIRWQGHSDLKLLTQVETEGGAILLQGEALYASLYLHELLLRLLPIFDPHPNLYLAYQQTLAELAHSTTLQVTLRLFEKLLLDELGYGLPLMHTVNGEPLLAEQDYLFYPGHGFVLREHETTAVLANLFSGKSILALANAYLVEADVLLEVKRLMRLALQPLLGAKPLQSRMLYL